MEQKGTWEMAEQLLKDVFGAFGSEVTAEAIGFLEAAQQKSEIFTAPSAEAQRATDVVKSSLMLNENEKHIFDVLRVMPFTDEQRERLIEKTRGFGNAI